MQVIQTRRLNLRWLAESDAEFIFDLLNQPSWLKFIGDRGVCNLDDAREYIKTGPLAMINTYGFGLYLTEIKASRTPIGLCGLLKRETLNDVDMGFAFHPDFWGQGYANEAARACMNYARDNLQLERIVAITVPSNNASIRLLKTIGMQYEKEISLGNSSEVLQLYARQMLKL